METYLTDRVADDAEWRRFLRAARIDAFERRWLRRMFDTYNPSLIVVFQGDRREVDLAFRRWCVEVVETEVALHPGGRATLRHSERADLTVEIRWTIVDGEPWVTQYTVGTPRLLPWVEISISPYIAALHLALERQDPPPAEHAEPPAAGKPISVDFYRDLAASHRALVRAGHPSPAKELASRMGANEATVRSWLYRGRRYLSE